jgi:hypothetical protein
MDYAVVMVLGGMVYIPGFAKIFTGPQILRGINMQTH